MRLLKAEDIPADLRRPHIDRYRKQLRDAMLHPALTGEQKAEIKERITNLGKPKPYAALAAKRAERDAAYMASFKTSEGGPALEELLAKSKDELVGIASDDEVPDVSKSWTKKQIAEAILAHREKERKL